MNYISELRFAGRPNRRVVLGDDDVGFIQECVKGLTFEPSDGGLCWTCPADDTPDLLASLSDDVADQYYIRGRTIYRGRSQAQLPAAMTQWIADTLAARSVTPDPFVVGSNRCDHAQHFGNLDPCGCGSPDDVAVWLPVQRCRFSVCFNFAVKDVWCSNGHGAQPTRYPSDLFDRDEWIRILEPDGLHFVRRFPDIPKGGNARTGWHVAFFVKEVDEQNREYHFLRLDGEYWTHKFSQRVPQACDAAGRPMPMARLHEAELCGFRFIAYFWVNSPLKLPRG